MSPDRFGEAPFDGSLLEVTDVKTGFETDRGALRRVLSQVRPGDEVGRPREALSLALSLLRGRGGRRDIVRRGR